MTVYLIKRLFWLIATLWIVYTVSFFLMRAVPGGPLQSERNLPPEIEQNMRERFNLDAHWSVQYITELGKAIKLDFGDSYRLKDFTVGEVIAEGFPISASLGIFAQP